MSSDRAANLSSAHKLIVEHYSQYDAEQADHPKLFEFEVDPTPDEPVTDGPQTSTVS